MRRALCKAHEYKRTVQPAAVSIACGVSVCRRPMETRAWLRRAVLPVRGQAWGLRSVVVAVAVLKPKAGQAGCGVAHPLLHLKVRMRKRSCAMLLLCVSVQVLLASLPLEPLHSLQRHADWDGIAFDQREPVWARSVRACKHDMQHKP
jgi:hypothetical protein